MAILPKRRNEEGQGGFPSLRDEVNRVFDEFFGRGWLTSPIETTWLPALDISETEETIEVRAEVPGIDPGDIDVSLTGDVLTIKGEKKEEQHENDENYSRIERRYGAFQRAVKLPAPVDPSKVKAVCKNGVLHLTLVKEKKTRPSAIDIKVE